MKIEISLFLQRAGIKLKDGSGSVEIISTSGTSILDEKIEHWVEYGVSNFDEIYLNVSDIVSMINCFESYEDDPSQFMYDIRAVLDDLSFHSSIYGIYFHNISNLFEYGELYLGSLETKNYLDENINNDSIFSDIAFSWDVQINLKDKIKIIREIYCYCLNVKGDFEKLFYKKNSVSFEDSGIFIERIYYYILKLQCFSLRISNTGLEG
jgi:hypothetical protein